MEHAKQGFTLLELLVVVLIVGILASVAIPQYFKTVERTRVAEALGMISSIKTSEDRYLARRGAYASDLTQLDLPSTSVTAAAITAKFFNGAVTVGACAGGPCYAITVTRHTNTTNVMGRYGTYSLNLNIPTAPKPVIVTCPGGASKCDELLN